ncbi:transcription factor AP-2 [Dictyocaulus viviparus]|uniref:Transcription factor AP-2 n=1 Tax=Dictyocaulus viviparus TaxID=29172 RepID=A0A0D8XI92_DICVI|nr:transcription factor AP-2 [Dictyocaulus viviparus]
MKRVKKMSNDMLMNNPSSTNRKRPLTDSTMEMNTPKREYYQQFNAYQYMNMMNPPPMFQSTPFTMRNDENQPTFMTGEFCQPKSNEEHLLIGEGGNSSSCENTPSTSQIEKSKTKDDEVLFQVPSRLNHISKNKVTLAELKRRIAAPECLNSSFLGIYLRLAKTKEVGKELRDNLAKHGISLPSGRRKGVQNTVFTCLVEEEATQLGRDLHTLVQQHYPIRPLIDMATRKTMSHPEERRRDLIGAIRILDELSVMFNELQTPLANRIQNNVPIHNELEVGMNHFSLITHTFGPINQSTWCNAFLNYAKMSLAMYQNRGMEPATPQYNH